MPIIPTNGDGRQQTKQVRSTSQRETSTPRERFIFGAPQQKMSVLKRDDGYHYHWINDTPGRLMQAELGGYVFVKREEVELLPGIAPRNSNLGDKVSMHVGVKENGDALDAFLMKIPLDLYEENQEYLQSRIDQTDAAIRQGRTTADTSTDDFYQPKGQPIRIGTKDI